METYTIVFNSANNKNRSGPGPNNYTYTTRWSTVIPPRLQDRKFSLTWTFSSDLGNTDVATAWLYVNLGASASVVDQSSNNSLLIGTVMPTLTWGGTEFWYQYHSGAADSCPITTSYPMQEQVTVSILDNDGVAIPAMSDYNLILCFTLMDDM